MKNIEQIERLNKIKKLAEQGFYGEQDNARKLLDKLLKKYNLEYSDILDEDIISEYSFYYHSTQEQKILAQIIYKVTNSLEIYGKRHNSNGKSDKRLYIKCTAGQKLDIEFLFNFYKHIFEKELELFLSAFIQKHWLFGLSKNSESNSDESKYSEQELSRIFGYMNKMEDVVLHKQIEQTDYSK